MVDCSWLQNVDGFARIGGRGPVNQGGSNNLYNLSTFIGVSQAINKDFG